MSVYAKRAERLSLSPAQRRVIDHDDIGWLGWDAANLPVILTPCEGRVALDRSGQEVAVTEPVQARDT